jgi:hypothetical protein
VILVLAAAVVLYLVVPAGLVVAATAALVIGIPSAVVSLAAGGPGVYFAARLTGAPRRVYRWSGWGLLLACSLGAAAAALVAIVMAVVFAGTTRALPTFLPFTG